MGGDLLVFKAQRERLRWEENEEVERKSCTLMYSSATPEQRVEK